MTQAAWITLGAIAVLLLISAFFSMAETALTGASRARMHHLARRGDRRAAAVRRLREDQENLLSAILLGNNTVNTLSASLATSTLLALFGDAGIAYATAAMTVLILIFGEILPKSYALAHADRVALTVAPIIRFLIQALKPVLFVVKRCVRLVLRVFGTPNMIAENVQEEELRGAIELHHGEDEEIRSERRMLRSVLELGDVEVGEIMVHRRNVVTIDASLPPAAVIDQVLSSPYTRIPLWRGTPENIVGVLHTKALLRAIQSRGNDMEGFDVTSVASPPWFIPEGTTLLDQLQEFRRRREHFAIVVDEYGMLKGVVTLEDILEEIVGEISDEHDLPVPGVRPQPDGSFVCAGTATIRDLNREYEWGLPDDKANTVAGLVLYESREIPEAGQAFDFYGFRFLILRRVRNQLVSIRVTPPKRRA